MTTAIQTAKRSIAFPIIMAASLGFAIFFAAGHLQAAALHDAAHDVRHATGFPCH